MIEKKIKKKVRKEVIAIAIKSSLISMAIGVFINLQQYEPTVQTFKFFIGVIIYGIIAFIISSTYVYVNNYIISKRIFKRLPYIISLLSNFFILTSITFASIFLVGIIFNAKEFIITKFGITIAFTISIILSIYFTITSMINSFVGKSFLSNLLKGKYHKAKEEKLIISFVDLVSSTKLTEQFGTQNFFDILNLFFNKLEKCCLFHKGFIYKYIGDGAILIWNDNMKEKVLDFYNDFEDEIKLLNKYLKSKYNINIKYKIGINYGKVLISEIENERKEIGYWGDTLNTAQRLESSCGKLNKNILFSNSFVNLFSNKSLFRKVAKINLKGKETSHEVFTIN